eukprot:TRINITY_DN16596_c0_g1_i4.p1 TRINITY_DN16596_c0_g1~~TRINITY_DN16596_c0_g1_i4.p1  ORF type:complete len:608 (+),score=57.17 TRINITY_DN16596_c0_g1_i4:39-1862(+)
MQVEGSRLPLAVLCSLFTANVWSVSAKETSFNASRQLRGSRLLSSDTVLAREWYIELADRTEGPWFVSEVAFYSDYGCTQEVGQGAQVVPSGAEGAFDKSTHWSTPRFRSSCNSCSAGDAWLGLRFASPLEVRCARILQASDTAVALIGSSGDVQAPPVSHSVFFNVFSNVWTTLRVPDRRVLYTVANDVPTLGRWSVSEMRLFSDAACTLDVSDDGAVIPWSADAAFDGLSSTAFRSLCSACLPSEAWVGRAFGDAHDIGCVQIQTTGADFIKLRRWEAGSAEWTGVKRWRVFGIGWHTLTLHEERSAYGIFNAVAVSDNSPFNIFEMELYTDLDCRTRIAAGGSPIASHDNGAAAVDGDESTSFEAPCTLCLAGTAWIAQVFASPVHVQCVRLLPGFEGPYLIKRWQEADDLWENVAAGTAERSSWVTIPLTEPFAITETSSTTTGTTTTTTSTTFTTSSTAPWLEDSDEVPEADVPTALSGTTSAIDTRPFRSTATTTTITASTALASQHKSNGSPATGVHTSMSAPEVPTTTMSRSTTYPASGELRSHSGTVDVGTHVAYIFTICVLAAVSSALALAAWHWRGIALRSVQVQPDGSPLCVDML